MAASRVGHESVVTLLLSSAWSADVNLQTEVRLFLLVPVGLLMDSLSGRKHGFALYFLCGTSSNSEDVIKTWSRPFYPRWSKIQLNFWVLCWVSQSICKSGSTALHFGAAGEGDESRSKLVEMLLGFVVDDTLQLQDVVSVIFYCCIPLCKF